MKPSEFLKLLYARKRNLTVTRHAKERLKMRSMREKSFRDDMQKLHPIVIEEQPSDSKNEKRFRLYYSQSGDYYHAYVILMNSEIKLITAWRPSKLRQKDIARGKYGVK